MMACGCSDCARFYYRCCFPCALVEWIGYKLKQYPYMPEFGRGLKKFVLKPTGWVIAAPFVIPLRVILYPWRKRLLYSRGETRRLRRGLKYVTDKRYRKLKKEGILAARDATTNDQSQSPFFKLPYELRLQIYEYCIEERAFHERGYRAGRFSPYSCKDHSAKARYFDQDSAVSSKGCATDSRAKRTPRDTRQSSPLLACRRMYAETAPLLYSRTHFIFPSASSFYNWLHDVSRDGKQWRRENIRSAEVGWTLDMHPSHMLHTRLDWKAFWAEVQMLEALRDLTVAIRPGPNFDMLDDKLQGRWLDPVAKVEQPENFGLRLCTRTGWFPVDLKKGRAKFEQDAEKGGLNVSAKQDRNELRATLNKGLEIWRNGTPSFAQ